MGCDEHDSGDGAQYTANPFFRAPTLVYAAFVYVAFMCSQYVERVMEVTVRDRAERGQAGQAKGHLLIIVHLFTLLFCVVISCVRSTWSANGGDSA